MTDFFTDTRSSMDACSLLDEEIAAFLDGTLSPEDCKRITAHLASCESCREVLAAAVEFQKYEAGIEEDVVPFPFGLEPGGTGVPRPPAVDASPFPFAGETDRTGVSRPTMVAPERVRPRTSRWLALAASLLLVPALGFVAWQFLVPPKMVLAEVAEPFERKEEISGLLYDGATRGDAPQGDTFAMRPHFMAGVHLLDLRLSVQAEDTERTAAHLQGLAASLQEIPLLPKGLAEKYREESLRMQDLPAKEAEIQGVLGDEQAFQLGLWTEAARLAALTESSEFFDRRKNSRFLSRLLKEETLPVPTDLHETVLEELQAVRNAWDLSPRSYALLAKYLENVIQAIDQYEEEDYSYEN
jgi:hypothetical protein